MLLFVGTVFHFVGGWRSVCADTIYYSLTYMFNVIVQKAARSAPTCVVNG